jgi:phage-related protein
MGNVASLTIKVITDAKDAAADLKNVGDGAGGFSSALSSATKVAAGAGLALAGFGKAAFDAASDAQQAAGAVDAVYGATASTIHGFAKTAATDVGLASSEYETMAAQFGAQLKNMGVAAEDLAPQTDELIGLGADLAAQYGGSTADAVGALGSLMRGETDPIEKYGVSIKSADIAAQKAEMGLSGLTGEADKAATTQAMLALLTDQTADATGAFGREADTAAGQQQRANAQMKDATAAIGTALLPLVSQAASLFGSLAGFIQQNAGAFQVLGAAVAGVVAIIFAVKAATMAWQAAQMVAKAASVAWTAVQWLLNAAMTANPIGLVVVAIAALVAGIIVLVKNWDTVTAAFQWTWEWLKANWPTLLAILTGPFGAAVLLIVKNWDTIKGWFSDFLGWFSSLWDRIKGIVSSVWNAISSVVSSVLARIESIVDSVAGAIESAWRGVQSVVSSVMSAIASVVSSVTSAISSAWQAVANVASSVASAISSAFSSAFHAVASVASSVMGAVRAAIDTISGVASAVAGALSGALSGAFRAVQSAGSAAFNVILGPINAVKGAIDAIIGAVNSLIGALSRIKIPKLPSLSDLNPFSVVPPAPAVGAARGAPMPGARATGGAFSTAGGAPVVINVTGALDPDAVARQIERILRARSRRVGGVASVGVGVR